VQIPRARGRRESALEARCVKWARFQGVVVAKLTGCDGVPDRVFFLPETPLIVEFKAKGETPEELQSWYLRTLKQAGYNVAWCDTWEEFQLLWQTVTSKTKKSKK
jgi:hypothetical protein